jgi:tetratricopeptide (TPR) repeat protein
MGKAFAGEDGKEKLARAIQAGVRRDYKTAARLLEEILSEYDAPPPEASLYLGRALHALGDYARALAAFKDYLTFAPHSGEGYFFTGRSYLSLGMPQRAIPFLKEALNRRPGNPQVMALLGTAYLKAKNSARAVEILQNAVEAAPENRRIYRAYLNALCIRGIRLCRREDYALGIQMLRFVLENGVDFLLLRLELGRAARELKCMEEALDHYTQAISFAPEDPMIRWYRASALMALGRNGEALEEIEGVRASLGGELPDLPWNSSLVDLFIIRSQLDAGQWRQAADSCRNWLKYRKPDPLIHALDAEALGHLGDYGAARNHLERALELEPHQLQLWYALLLNAWEARDWDTLKRALSRAQKIAGEDGEIRRFRVLYEDAVRSDDAAPAMIEALQGAIRSLGPDPELMYALAERYLKTGLIEAALSWFKKVLTLQGGNEKSHLGAIAALEVLFKEGKPRSREELAAAYGAYLDRWGDNYHIRRDRAIFFVKAGEFSKAVPELELLLAWESANPTLRRLLAYAYRKTGRYREAAVFLKALLKEKPGDTGLLLEYSRCLERAGAAPYARMVLEKALGVFNRSPEVPLALALLLYREQKIEAAFDLLREAAGRAPRDPRPYEWMARISRKIGAAAEALRYEEEARKRGKKG